jgi:tRNA A-37 threonylcarbamoyl transferase component Bud32
MWRGAEPDLASRLPGVDDAAVTNGQPGHRVRRRPSGEPPPLPREQGWIRWAWVVAAVVLLGVIVASIDATTQGTALDDTILRWFADHRSTGLVNVAKVLEAPTDLRTILLVRVAVAVVLVIYQRFRHLVAFVATFAVVDWVVAQALSVPLTPPDVSPVIPPGPFYFPSRPLSTIAITLILSAFVLAPRGSARRAALAVAYALITIEVMSQLILATDVPTAMAYSWLLAAVVPPLVFRWWVPEDVFPVSYARGGTAAHLDLGGARQTAVIAAMADQLGLDVTKVEPFGLEGSGGSSPLRMTFADGTRVFGKIYSTSHVRADRWYRIGRTIMYGQLEDETPIGSVRRLTIIEDYALRFLRDAGIRVAATYGIVELTPNQEYMLVTEFFEGSKNLGDSEIDDVAIDEGLQLVRTLWDIGAAHRDVKPANMLIKDGHLQLVDVSGLEIRPSSWRQAVDLANMMLTLALRTDADRVYARATAFFKPDEIAEAFASDVGLAVPTELSAKSKADGRPLRERFRELAPARASISIQRWSSRRLLLTAIAALTVFVLAGLFVDALRAGIT